MYNYLVYKLYSNFKSSTEMTDALGNTSEVKQAKKVVSKRDEKALVKALRKKIATGGDLDIAYIIVYENLIFKSIY